MAIDEYLVSMDIQADDLTEEKIEFKRKMSDIYEEAAEAT